MFIIFISRENTESFSKEESLTDTTAAQFGFGTGAVPDDVLSYLGRYAEYWWALKYNNGYSYYEYAPSLSAITSKTGFFNGEAHSYGITCTLSCADRISVNSDGVTLLNPTSMNFTTAFSSANVQKIATSIVDFLNSVSLPCYIQLSASDGSKTDVYYLDSGATFINDGKTSGAQLYTVSVGYNGSSDDYYNVIYFGVQATVPAQKVSVTSTLVTIPPDETDYKHSTDRNAYPDSGTVDDITYKYLGVPFEKFPTAPQIEVGSYIGTGTYGSSNKNSLTFSFVPKLVFIRGPRADPNAFCCFVYDSPNADMVYEGGGTSLSKAQIITWSDKTISWYSSSSALIQMNQSNKIYVYVAIG